MKSKALGLKIPRVGALKICARLLRESRAHWLALALILLFSLLATPLALLAPVPMKVAVDSLLDHKPLPAYADFFFRGPFSTTIGALIGVSLLSFFVLILQAVQGYIVWVYQLYVGEQLVINARTRLFLHVQRLSLQRHDERGTPDLLFRLQNDVYNMQHLSIYGLIPFCTTSAMFLTMFVVTLRLDWQLSLIALGVLPVLWVLGRIHSDRSRTQWAAAKETDRAAIAVLQEGLNCIRVVQAFAQEEREVARFRERAELNLRSYLRAVGMDTIFGLLIAAAIAFATSLALGLGLRHVQTGALSLGNFLIVMAYLAQLFKPLEMFSKQVAALQASLASAERVYAVADELPDIREKSNAQPIARARGDFEFRDVSFRYRADQPGLQNLSFKIRAGQKVGIVGSTGAGKTTLVSLLLRFYDPSHGEVTLDGHDLKDLRLKDLRQQFATVLQEPVLFSGTIFENIRYARPQASFEEAVAAARSAEAHEFILKLPDGYDTIVGERCMNLSGGERQRLSIARAFLADAPILILDEPTSSLDHAREAMIGRALDRLQAGRTTFTITHRPALIENYDVILQLEHGRLLHPGFQQAEV